MTSFHDDREKTDAVKSFPHSAERAVILGEAFEGLEHALLVFDAGGKLISANARTREILDLPGNGARVGAFHQEDKPDDRH
jgi:PAS domain-containing protein